MSDDSDKLRLGRPVSFIVCVITLQDEMQVTPATAKSAILPSAQECVFRKAPALLRYP
jgi:hypothetical protein